MRKAINRIIHNNGVVVQVHCAIFNDIRTAGVGGVYHTYEIVPETFVPLSNLNEDIVMSWIPEYFWIDLERQLVLQIETKGTLLESTSIYTP